MKTWHSLIYKLSSSSSFIPAVFSSVLLSGHPPPPVTSASQLCVRDGFVGQSSQHISHVICRSGTSLLALQLDGQPVSHSNRQPVSQRDVRHGNSQQHRILPVASVSLMVIKGFWFYLDKMYIMYWKHTQMLSFIINRSSGRKSRRPWSRHEPEVWWFESRLCGSIKCLSVN